MLRLLLSVAINGNVMRSLPSITVTFRRVFILYKNSFIDVLPFVLLVLMIQVSFSKLLPVNETTETAYIFLHVILKSLITSFFFCCVIYAIFLKHYQQNLKYGELISKGLTRVIPMIVSGIILISPLILMMGMFMIISVIIVPDSNTASMTSKIIFLIMQLIISVATFFYVLIVFVYCYLSGVLIVCKNATAWLGIKQSLKLVSDNWWYVFSRMLLLLVIIIIPSMLLYHFLAQQTADGIITIFTFSLGPCLMVILHEILESSGAADKDMSMVKLPEK